MAGVALDAAIDAEDPDPVEPVRIGDQDPLSLGQDRVVGGVPRHCQAVGDAGDGQALGDDRLQRPAQPTAGQLRARLPARLRSWRHTYPQLEHR